MLCLVSPRLSHFFPALCPLHVLTPCSRLCPYTQTRHQFEIHLENSSVVEVCNEEDDIPHIFFNVRPCMHHELPHHALPGPLSSPQSRAHRNENYHTHTLTRQYACKHSHTPSQQALLVIMHVAQPAPCAAAVVTTPTPIPPAVLQDCHGGGHTFRRHGGRHR